jgi:phosphatidyl-myo-inositol dimannoside synthase
MSQANPQAPHNQDLPSGRRILCLVTDAYGGTGGIALYNRDVIEAMVGDPGTASVVVLPRVVAAALEAIPPKVSFVESALGSQWRYVAALLGQMVPRRRFDLIYCAHVNLIPLARLASAWLDIPWVLCIYGVDGWTPSPRYWSQRWSHLPDLVISLSQVTQDRFLSWCPIDLARCVVVPNALHIEQFGLQDRDAALVARYGLQGKKVILTLGRLDPDEQAKGFDRIIALLPELLKAVPELAYLIVGMGRDRDRLEALAQACGVAQHVIFAGFVAEQDKAAHYALADAYVMPSTLEGFGFVYTEAMACGLPVVGSSTDGSREALRDGALGQLVDPFDALALKAAILTALVQPKHVPAGLDHFSFANFQARINAALARLK